MCVRAIEVVFFVGLKLGSGHKFPMSKRSKHLYITHNINAINSTMMMLDDDDFDVEFYKM